MVPLCENLPVEGGLQRLTSMAHEQLPYLVRSANSLSTSHLSHSHPSFHLLIFPAVTHLAHLPCLLWARVHSLTRSKSAMATRRTREALLCTISLQMCRSITKRLIRTWGELLQASNSKACLAKRFPFSDLPLQAVAMKINNDS